MKVILPVIVSIFYFFLSITINIVKKNSLGISIGRSIFSAIIVAAITFAVIIILEKFVGIDFNFDRVSFSDDNDSADELGDKVDYVVDDDSDGSEDLSIDEEDSSLEENMGGDVGDDTTDIDTIDYNSDDEGGDYDSSIAVDSMGDSVRDKLGIDASVEDMAKAVRTVMKRDKT